MNLGFEVVAARSKKTDANDDLAFEPMRQRARKEPRKQPSTDEKKVKRRLTKSAVAWSRRDSLDHDTEYVRQVLLGDTEALEASVIRDETMDEPTWAWLVSVIDRKDGGILEFVMSGSASGLDEAKGKADVALDRAEMDMMFERFSSRKQAAKSYIINYQSEDGFAVGDEVVDREELLDILDDLQYPAEPGDSGTYTYQNGTVMWNIHSARKQAGKNYYVFDEWADDTGSEERPLAGPFASAEEASAVLKDVAYPFQFPYGPATVVGDLFIAEGLPQMDTQDFINQTLSNKQAGYHYQPDTESSFDVNRYDESPGEPFAHPSGHTYSGPEPAEATGESYVGSRSSSMQREADILEAMRFASLTEQRQLMAELNTIRANRTAARQADRDIDLTAAVIEDRLTPVLTKSMHTTATDWLDEVVKDEDDDEDEKSDKEASREMVAQASVWFKRLSSEVIADRDEFAEQARGKARQLTSSLGVGREAAIASFLDAAAHLRAKKSAGASKKSFKREAGQVIEWSETEGGLVAEVEDFDYFAYINDYSDVDYAAGDFEWEAGYLSDSLSGWENTLEDAQGAAEEALADLERMNKKDGHVASRKRRRSAHKTASNAAQDAAFYQDDANGGARLVETVKRLIPNSGGYAYADVHVSGMMRVLYGDETLRTTSDLLDAGFDTDAKLDAAERNGEIEWLNNPWFEVSLWDDESGDLSGGDFSVVKHTMSAAIKEAERALEEHVRSRTASRKRANELMGYGEGEYVTNAGDDMMMDDMSGMDMDPRYETNASRKRAGSQYIVRGWFGDEAIGDSEPDVEFVANSMERAEEESEYYDVLGYQTTIQELSWKGASRKRSSRKVAYLPHEGEGDITNSQGDEFYKYAEDGNTEWFYIYANTLFHLKEFHNIDLTDTFIHLDDGGPGLQMEELVQSAHALEHEGDSGVYGSRKQASLSVQDLLSTVLDSNHGGFGYRDAIRTIEWITAPSNFERDSDAASRGEKHEFPPFSADDVHNAVIEQANRLGLSREELFIWSNSTYARHFGDELTFYDRPLRDTVERYMNASIIDRLNSQIAEGKRGKRARKQAMPRTVEVEGYTADELTGSARDRARQDWDVMQWDLFVADDISEYLNEELARKLPSFAGTKVVWAVGFSQGDGVWLETGPLSRQQVLDLGVDLPQGVSLEVVDGGAGGVNLEADYPLGIDIEEKFEIEDLRNAAETALNGVLYDLYGMARDYVMDAGSEEYWIDWADENDVLYDQSGRIIRQGSLKQAMPSDDLIDVDIEDYMGGDEGPDPDSQSGHAETALPYAGDDMTPAFRETGWTGKRKRRANRKTASGFYDYGGGVVELGVFGGDNQVGNSYGRIFVKQNEDGTYDRVDVGYYAAVNSVMDDEADELIAANEVYVEEQTWEWKGIADPETDESPTSIDYRNDMLMTNVSLAEAERIAEQYARDLSARGDHIASRKRGSASSKGRNRR